MQIMSVKFALVQRSPWRVWLYEAKALRGASKTADPVAFHPL